MYIAFECSKHIALISLSSLQQLCMAVTFIHHPLMQLEAGREWLAWGCLETGGDRGRQGGEATFELGKVLPFNHYAHPRLMPDYLVHSLGMSSDALCIYVQCQWVCLHTHGGGEEKERGRENSGLPFANCLAFRNTPFYLQINLASMPEIRFQL